MQNRCLILGIKEVRLDALEAHLCPFRNALFLLFWGLQVGAVRPNNQANALFVGILDQIFGPVIIALINGAIIRVRILSLPAFVEQLIFPAHLYCEVDIIFIDFKSFVLEIHIRVCMTKVAIEPSPVNCTRLYPAGIFQLAVLAQGLRHGIFCNRLRGTDDGKTPRRCKRSGCHDVVGLFRSKGNIQQTSAIAYKLCATIGRIQVCLGEQRPNAIGGFIEERHAVAAAKLMGLFLLCNGFICIFIFHRLCNRTACKLESRILFRNGEFLAIFGFNHITERHAIVVHTNDDAIGSAALCKVQRHLVARSVHMVHFSADQVIGVRNLFILTAHKGEAVAEIANVRYQSRGGAGNNGFSCICREEADSALSVHKEQCGDILVGRCNRPSCALFPFANNDLTGRCTADARIDRIHHCTSHRCNAVCNAGNDTRIRINGCNLRIVTGICALFRGDCNALLTVGIRGDHQIGAVPYCNSRLFRLYGQCLQTVHHSAVADNLCFRPNGIRTTGVFHRQHGCAFWNFHIHRYNPFAAGQILRIERLAIRLQCEVCSSPPVIRLNGNLCLETQRTIAGQVIDDRCVTTRTEALFKGNLLPIFVRQDNLMYVDISVLTDLPPSILSGCPFHIAEIYGGCLCWICTVFLSLRDRGKPTGKYKRKYQEQGKCRPPCSFSHDPFLPSWIFGTKF